MRYCPYVRWTMAVALAFAAWAATAAPAISVDRVQQRYPWNGLVDIDYTIAGLAEADDPCDYVVSLAVSGETNGVPFSVSASNFVGCAGCDLPSTNGTFRATWDSAADGALLVAPSASFALTLSKSLVSEREAEFMIIDLSSGYTGKNYPVRYVRPGWSTRDFNHPLYKTDKIVMKRVKAGDFTMGYSVSWKDTNHVVRLTKDFFLGVFQVTQRQYKLLMNQSPSYLTTVYPDEPDNRPEWRPVEKIAWDKLHDALENVFMNLNAKVRKDVRVLDDFRLPTEAEWEYSCRAGTTTDYYWGDGNVDDYMWYSGNSMNPLDNPNQGHTHTVGTKLPNDWGFYDMAGNVFEFCSDSYAEYTDDPVYAKGEGGITIDPKGPLDPDPVKPVLRGGAARVFGSGYGASGNRYHYDTNYYGEPYHGFRLARTVH